MTDFVEPTNTGWSSLVLIIAAAIPFVFLWNPLRDLINEYRLYRRCQQYPQIVVCKEKSTAARLERKIGDLISFGVALLSRFLFDVMRSFIGFMAEKFSGFLASISKQKSTTAEASVTEIAGSKEIIEERTMNSSRSTKQVNSALHRPLDFVAPRNDLNFERKLQTSSVQRQSEEMFESSIQNIDKVETPIQKGQHTMMTRPSDTIQRRHTTIHSRPPKGRLPIQMMVTTSNVATLTRSVDTDSSSLSEKMRKRRFGEGENSGYDFASGDGAQSRKRRKLNVGRMPLQGCVARRPAAAAWQTTKILGKREREEREERLLRSMSRKRTRPEIEIHKKLTPAPTSTMVPASPTPAFNFGQTIASNSATLTSASGTTVNASKKEAKFDGAHVKSAANTSSTFSFGNTPDGTANTAAISKTAHASASSSQTPAPSFQFNGSSGGASGDDKSKGLPAPTFGTTNPSFGAAPVAAPQRPPSQDQASAAKGTSSTPAVPALSFGATPAAPTQVPQFGGKATASSEPPKFGAAPAQASTGAPTNFGAPSTSSTANSSGFQFGGTNGQPASAPAPSGQSGSQGFNHNPLANQSAKPSHTQQPSFGNTKENTNPGGFNSTFQTSAPSNGFLKPQAPNVAMPSFGNGISGAMPAFSAGAAPSTGASARRMARRARSRRR